jgi:excisionase family DNA binding protein
MRETEGVPDTVTAVEAAALLRVNERTIRRAIARGDLVATRQGRGFAITLVALEHFRRQNDLSGEPGSQPPRSESDARSGSEFFSPASPLPPELDLDLGLDTAADIGPRAVRTAVADRPRLASLPAPLTSFVGREREAAALRALLEAGSDRLLTLTGPGGTGKTRLAQEVAAAVAPRFADGAAFVALAPVADAGGVLPEILAALGLRDLDERPPLERLRAELRDRRLLLLLDNLEHLVAAAPALVELLTSCPGLTMLVTSRVPLHVSGERRVAVAPLALPAGDANVSRDEVASAEAVQLFVERAGSADPSFALTDGNAAAVVEICRRLDGLPLAIELAAARSAVLAPAALLDRLERRLPLLTGGPRDQPDRLRTMRGAITWSEDLLDASTQGLLRRLGVFAGGFPLAAAEAVADADISALDGLAALLDGGLLQRDTAGAERRFRMLETVREYALDRLVAAGEEAAARHAHAAWCLAMVDAAQPALATTSGAILDQFETEHANLRAALTWSIEHDPETALRLASGLAGFWSKRSYWTEGRAWLERALATSAGDGPPRAAALGRLATMQSNQGDFDAARSVFEESLALAERLGERRTAAASRRGLGIIASNQSDFAAATAFFEAALAGFRAIDDRPSIARCLNDLGLVASRQGKQDAAIAWQTEALPIARAIGDEWHTCVVLGNLGSSYFERGDYARGEALFDEALVLARRLGDTFGVAVNLYNLGCCALVIGNAPVCAERFHEVLGLTLTLGERHLASRVIDRVGVTLFLNDRPRPAARLFGAAAALRESIGDSMFPIDDSFMMERIGEVRAALGPATYEAAWETGRSLPYEAATAEATALAAVVARAPGAVDLGLTAREIEVLRLLADGKSDKEIADALFLARTTTSKHVATVIAKLGVESRTAAVAFALRHRLI